MDHASSSHHAKRIASSLPGYGEYIPLNIEMEKQQNALFTPFSGGTPSPKQSVRRRCSPLRLFPGAVKATPASGGRMGQSTSLITRSRPGKFCKCLYRKGTARKRDRPPGASRHLRGLPSGHVHKQTVRVGTTTLGTLADLSSQAKPRDLQLTGNSAKKGAPSFRATCERVGSDPASIRRNAQ